MNILAIILIMFSSIVSKIEKLLNVANTPKQLIEIRENFNTPKNKEIFQYFPDINPLNPQRMNRFSSEFGERFHPIDKVRKQHLGLDISAPKNLPVHSSAKGKVVFLGHVKGYGKLIIIKHKYGFITKYAHLNHIVVTKDQTVKKGDIIGMVGSTGKSTGDHLHYEIIKNKKAIDPYLFVNLN